MVKQFYAYAVCLFMLVLSRSLAKEKLLQLYYTWDQVEKVFELCKQHGKILQSTSRRRKPSADT
jgi:hypothetical protein